MDKLRSRLKDELAVGLSLAAALGMIIGAIATIWIRSVAS